MSQEKCCTSMQALTTGNGNASMNVDFSRDILAHQANRLLVLRDSSSGWEDLGSSGGVLGLLAKNVNQGAWFPQVHGSSPKARKLREFT